MILRYDEVLNARLTADYTVLDFLYDVFRMLYCIVQITCRLVLWSEKGELKKHVTMLMTVSVT